MAGATIAATGTGSPRRCATTTTSSRPTCAATATPPGPPPATTRWRTTSTTSRSSSISRSSRRCASSPIRSAATSRCATPASIPRRCRRLVAIEGLGPPPTIAPSAPTARRSPSACATGSTSSRALSGRLPRRYASIEDALRACRRRTRICRPSRRAISRSTASTRTRTAPIAGSSTTTCRVWPPYDMTREEIAAAVVAHRLPDAAGLRQGELGVEPGGRRTRGIFPRRTRARRRRRRPLGASRSARAVPARGARLSATGSPPGAVTEEVGRRSKSSALNAIFPLSADNLPP